MKSKITHNLLYNINKIVLFGALAVIVSPAMAEKSSHVQEMYIVKGEHAVILDTVKRMHENIYLRLRNMQEDKLNRIKAEILAEQALGCSHVGHEPGDLCG